MTITLRRANPDDAAAFARIMGDPQVFPGLMQMPHTDAHSWKSRLTDTCAPGKTDLPLVAELHGEVVGTAGLHPVGPHLRRRHALVLGISVAPSAQGKGVGSALMAAMCDYADNWVGALRLELTVYTDNAAALRLYRKFGFEVEGTFKGYALRDGQYVDAHAMVRFHPNPPRIGN
ncbi:GNAT family N-acetyltransferase [Rhizobacter sp. SG703]|uniref:GNAT family N-acetyltransferase n=1 Tax=Rhizobacter sp. SG703 TaxID=2587140 RepID=UPI001446AFD8|nr:GNAT family N-acetyltransferase [Rhizobacter sp. SG703]NKI93378.1 putative acetyltransferase [Rhizobacter sp. SG703]